MRSKKRHPIEICYDLLTALKQDNDLSDNSDGLSVTSLMYHTHITNTLTFYSKLKPLFEGGYINSPSMNKYQITDKGREYLKTLSLALSLYNNNGNNDIHVLKRRILTRKSNKS